jgi:hypothetical protein
MVRLFTSVFCTLATPILVVWGYSLSVRESHRELPHWRNSMGLTSIILILANWSVELLGWALFLSRVNWPGFDNFGWYWWCIEIYTLPLALLLALGWKGIPRLQIFGAGIFAWVLTVSFVYV